MAGPLNYTRVSGLTPAMEDFYALLHEQAGGSSSPEPSAGAATWTAARGAQPGRPDTSSRLDCCQPCAIQELSDDLLARIFSLLDSGQLRRAAGTCRRWAALLRARLELWGSVALALPPKRSRGRDRRARS